MVLVAKASQKRSSEMNKAPNYFRANWFALDRILDDNEHMRRMQERKQQTEKEVWPPYRSHVQLIVKIFRGIVVGCRARSERGGASTSSYSSQSDDSKLYSNIEANITVQLDREKGTLEAQQRKAVCINIAILFRESHSWSWMNVQEQERKQKEKEAREAALQAKLAELPDISKYTAADLSSSSDESSSDESSDEDSEPEAKKTEESKDEGYLDIKEEENDNRVNVSIWLSIK